MNKKNYILNNASTKYFEYFFLKKLAGTPEPTPAVEGEGTNFTLEPTSNKRFADVKSKGNTSQQSYTGKNKFNVNITPDWIGGNTTYNVNNNELIVSGKWFIGISVPTKTNTTYYVSAIRKNMEVVGTTGEIRIYTSPNGSNIAVFTGETNGSFNSGNNTSVDIVFYANNGASGTGSVTFSEIQVEEGSSKTDYEPYVGGISAPNPDYPQDVNVVTGTQTITITNGTNTQNYTITLGSIELCKIDDYQDYIYKDGDDWYIHKEIRKVILNGSEAWDKNASYDNGFIVKSSDPSFQHTKYFGGYSNQYTIVNDSTTWQGAGKAGFNNSRVFWLQTIATDYTLQTFKESLSTNNIIVYCVESTAINTKITDATLIADLNNLLNNGYLKKGTNTITTSATGSNLPTIIYIKSN